MSDLMVGSLRWIEGAGFGGEGHRRRFQERTRDRDQYLPIPSAFLKIRWEIEMSAIIARSKAILSDAGLGMAMFSLGLFMALQPRIIVCGNVVASFAMAVRFVTRPAVMAVTSIVVVLRGVLLNVAIVQAAIPQGIVPFVFTKEYNVHPEHRGYIWHANCFTHNACLLHIAGSLKQKKSVEVKDEQQLC